HGAVPSPVVHHECQAVLTRVTDGMGGPPENWYSHAPARPRGGFLLGPRQTRPGDARDAGAAPAGSTIARPCDTPHSLRAPWTPAARGAQPGPATSQAGPTTNTE